MDPPHVTLDELTDRLVVIGLGSNKLVLKSIEQAKKSHGNQKRDQGTSYLEEHIYPVTLDVINYAMSNLIRLSPELVASALLHDTLEDDSDLTENAFRRKFGEKVYSIVKPLTKPDYKLYPGITKEEKKMALNASYFAILKKAHQEAKIIKLADRLNNLSGIHLSPQPGKMEFYIEETKVFYLSFAKEVSPAYFERIKAKVEWLEQMN